MKEYNVVFHKHTQQYEFKFFSHEKYNNKEKLSMFLNIISLFQIQKMNLQGTCFTNDKNAFLDELSMIDRNINSNSKPDKRGVMFEIVLEFRGELIEKITNLVLSKNLTLYICQSDNSQESSRIELLVNDREYWSLTFRKDVIDLYDFISKLDIILKEPHYLSTTTNN